MASISNIGLYLHQRGKQQKKATIQLRFFQRGVAYYITSNIKVEVALWDRDKCRLKTNKKVGVDSSHNIEAELTNRQLQAFLVRAKEAILDAERVGREVTPAYLREVLTRTKESIPKVVECDVLINWQRFIDEQQTSFEVRESTIKAYVNARNHFAKFSKQHKRTFQLDELNTTLATSFVAYLRSLGSTNTTCNGVVKNLKRFCRWASEKGLLNSESYKLIKRPTTDPTDFIYLNEREIEVLANATLPIHLERVRDLWVIQASTGLRYSDLVNLKPVNRKGSVITLVTVKTNEALQIPLLPSALNIYKKYEETGLPKALQNQPYNRAIKEAARLAGLTDPILITVIKKGKRVEAQLPKCDKISSHTARRSFIINCLQRKVRPEVLMTFTGHADLKTMYKYVKILPDIAFKEILSAFGVENDLKEFGIPSSINVKG